MHFKHSAASSMHGCGWCRSVTADRQTAVSKRTKGIIMWHSCINRDKLLQTYHLHHFRRCISFLSWHHS